MSGARELPLVLVRAVCLHRARTIVKQLVLTYLTCDLQITGATGYIGAHVLQQALQAGYTVRALVYSFRIAREQDTYIRILSVYIVSWIELIEHATQDCTFRQSRSPPRKV